MEELLLIGLISILNIVCFFIGARIGQKIVKGDEIKLPSPVKVVEEYKEKKEYKEEMSKLNTVLDNIDTYDGTSIGQREVE